MELINSLIDNQNIPILTAFLLGLLTSISPCPLATNITAVAYISKELKSAKNTLLNGLFYTLGRGVSYTILATLIFFGLSSFSISSIFQGWGDKVLGPILIIIGLIMFDVIKINLKIGKGSNDKVKEWLSKKGYVGSLLLGMLFALAFCPYSGVLFFGALIPLVLSSTSSLLLPPVFALGTGLPIIIFSFLIAFSMKKVSKTFKAMQKIEKVMRYFVAGLFIAVGIYYTRYLVEFIINML
ncbi:MAG: aromatic aminobenezylarsenical efflux permease ArsG family transporter [Patescibacteria group bacterium]|jgi:cytochrome c-type biogenesis protein|nr:aromatic aminobenezylarsenical efflux permease ArsG family transporter [Patescibacteria group bacterium]